MHISEGVLSVPVLAAGAALAIVAVGRGVRRLPDELVPLAGLLCAMFFVASLIHLPVGVGAVHLVLNGLCGILLGWSAFPVITVALVLQALLFGFGGLAVLGVNILVMGLPALAAAWLFRAGAAPVMSPREAVWRAGLAGGAAIVLGLSLMTAALWLSSGAAYLPLIAALLFTHLPVILVEAVVTAAIVSSLARTRPALLRPVLTA